MLHCIGDSKHFARQEEDTKPVALGYMCVFSDRGLFKGPFVRMCITRVNKNICIDLLYHPTVSTQSDADSIDQVYPSTKQTGRNPPFVPSVSSLTGPASYPH